MREFFNEDAQCLTSQEKSRIKKVCDLTKYYFMEKYLLSLTEFPESVISVMVNDMDRFYTDSNANKLNQSYINALARKGYPEDVLKDIRVVLPRSEFEIFSKEFYMNLCMMAENGQDVVISSDTNKFDWFRAICNLFETCLGQYTLSKT